MNILGRVVSRSAALHQGSTGFKPLGVSLLGSARGSGLSGEWAAFSSGRGGEDLSNADAERLADQVAVDQDPFPAPEAAEFHGSSGGVSGGVDGGNIVENEMISGSEPVIVPEGGVGSEMASEVVEKVSQVSMHGFGPITGLMDTLDALHGATGLPWWGTIAVSTLAIRMIMLPVALKGAKNAEMLQIVSPQVQQYSEAMKKAHAEGNAALAGQHAAKVRELWSKYDVHPLKAMALPLMSAPVFISFFVSLRRMAEEAVMHYPGLVSGGFGPWTDLTVTDSTYTMPVTAAALFLASVELGADGVPASGQQAVMRNITRALALFMIPISATMPCAIFAYWIPTSIFSLAQLGLMRLPAVRVAVGLTPERPKPPPPPPGSSNGGGGFMESFMAGAKSAQAAPAGGPVTFAQKPVVAPKDAGSTSGAAAPKTMRKRGRKAGAKRSGKK